MRYELRLGQTFSGFSAFSTNGKLIVLLNGFQKKSQKTPKAEIEQAEKLRKQYFDEKENN